MSKNIVIYSDGTGQSSGIFLDENRSNIYKLFRATRCGPDIAVDPSKQLTFYDPGIGTSPIGANFFVRQYRRIYNIVSQATGLGLTNNVIDCYAAILRMWEPGDRIFLFGFSRGAYTVRCLGGVLSFCGVPTQTANGKLLKRDIKTSRSIAKEAVTKVYQHTASIKPGKADEREKSLLQQRGILAARFRSKYGSGDEDRPNVEPHFIGVFDTVSSVASPMVVLGLGTAAIIFLSIASWLLSFWVGNFGLLSSVILGVAATGALFWYLKTHLKVPGALRGHSWLKTVTLTNFMMGFDDMRLSEGVSYARHAISIDEDRKSFPRVKWGTKGKWEPPGENGVELFEQVWFAGNHSDIGGSYSENDARLSDISLDWMFKAAQSVGLVVDPNLLNLYPDATGPQHDERRSLLFKYAGVKKRSINPKAVLHPFVYDRLQAVHVLQFDEMKPYRPVMLSGHKKAGEYFEKCDTGAAT